MSQWYILYFLFLFLENKEAPSVSGSEKSRKSLVKLDDEIKVDNEVLAKSIKDNKSSDNIEKNGSDEKKGGIKDKLKMFEKKESSKYYLTKKNHFCIIKFNFSPFGKSAADASRENKIRS